MNRKNRERLCDMALKLWGVEAQVDMAVEEASEFIKAICKARRVCGEIEYLYLFEEMADLEIMLEQMKQIFGCHEVVEEQKQRKLARLEKTIHEEVKRRNENQNKLH